MRDYFFYEGTPRLGACGQNKTMEMRGIEPRAFHMQSERSTTELHPRRSNVRFPKTIINSFAIIFQPHLKGSNLRIFKSLLALEILFLPNIKYKNGLSLVGTLLHLEKLRKRFQSPWSSFWSTTVNWQFEPRLLNTLNRYKSKAKKVPSVQWL